MIDIGEIVLKLVVPILEILAPAIPGKIFPYFFTMEMLQRSLVAALLVTFVSGFLGVFLLIRNLALVGDGLAHVSFGGVALSIAFGIGFELHVALLLSVVSAIIIYEFQAREILSGDASIGIFLTGMLALGLVSLRVWGGGVQNDIEGYLFGNILLVSKDSFNLICTISILTIIFFLVSCTKKSDDITVLKETNLETQMIELYNQGMLEFNRGDVIFASKKFNEATDYTIYNEDDTIGNLLAYQLFENNKVDFDQ